MESLERREVFSTDLLSAISFGNDSGDVMTHDLAVDTAGNKFVTGGFAGTVDFDSSSSRVGDTDILTARGAQDAFLAKYAPDNSLIWARRMGGDTPVAGTGGTLETDVGMGIRIDTSGNVYVVGSFASSSDFQSIILTTSGDKDGFVAKFSSGGTVQWVKSWGNSAIHEVGTSVGLDAGGNVYVSGGQTGESNSANRGLDMRKFNSAGNLAWSKFVNTGDFGWGKAEVDSSGNVFAVGSFRGLVDFDPGPKSKLVSPGGASPNGITSFVLKLNTQGNFGWVSTFQLQGYAQSSASSIALDSSGNIVVGGSYSMSSYSGGNIDFNPGSGVTTLPNRTTGSNGYIAKLNPNGGLVWAKALESNDLSTGIRDIVIGPGGSVITSGYFNAGSGKQGTMDFDPGPANVSRTSAGGTDIFLLNLTSSGNFGWVVTFGGTQHDFSGGIALDASGDILMAGFIDAGTIDLDPGTGTYNFSTAGNFRNSFVARYRRS